MENPFDKYAIHNKPSIIKFDMKLSSGKLYAENSSDIESKIKLQLLVDAFIPFGINTIKSLDFNLYAMNNRSDTPSDAMYLKPVSGVQFNVDESRMSDNHLIKPHNGVYNLDYTFDIDSPFVGANFDLLGVNIVVNRQSLKDGSITKENIFTTVIPAYYLEEKNNE